MAKLRWEFMLWLSSEFCVFFIHVFYSNKLCCLNICILISIGMFFSFVIHTSRVVHIPSVFWSLQKWISNREIYAKKGVKEWITIIQRSLYWGNLHKNVLFMLWWNFTLQTFHQTTSCVESVYVHGKITPNPMNLFNDDPF